MRYVLPELNYEYKALEPHIDEQTMVIHHTKHHQAYITNAKAALDNYPDLLAMDPVELLKNLNKVPNEIRAAVQNNVGGHVNHTLFWETLTPAQGQLPSGVLLDAIVRDFGSLDSLKNQLDVAAKTRFGSGWAWLVVNHDKSLEVVSTANQDSPYTLNQTPILGIDVWEHAYYLHYQNMRPAYIQNWFEVINWDEVARRFEETVS